MVLFLPPTGAAGSSYSMQQAWQHVCETYPHPTGSSSLPGCLLLSFSSLFSLVKWLEGEVGGMQGTRKACVKRKR